MMTIEGVITVIKGWRSKKIIQFRVIGDARWNDCIGDPAWNFEGFEYRVKPEKKVGYLNVYEPQFSTVICGSRQEADRLAGTERTACIRVEYEAGQFDE